MDTTTAWEKAPTRDGRFRRKQSEFHSWLSEEGPHPPAAGRYHLYVQYACPWAHRTLLTRRLRGLEDAVSVDVVDWRMQDDGSWVFNPDEPGCTPDTVNGTSDLQEVYRKADPDFPSIGTVPILWDRKAGTIVNNESREIVRMMDAVLAPALDTQGAVETLLPDGLEEEVDHMIDANYGPVNDGVYKCGFARTQEAYDEAAHDLFARLDELESHLDGRHWLVGPGEGVLTEADVCLWPTLLRFDPVYFVHFKTSRNLIREMPNLWAYVKRFWSLPGVADTVNMDHIRRHYFWSHRHLNPNRIVPVGPWIGP